MLMFPIFFILTKSQKCGCQSHQKALIFASTKMPSQNYKNCQSSSERKMYFTKIAPNDPCGCQSRQKALIFASFLKMYKNAQFLDPNTFIFICVNSSIYKYIYIYIFCPVWLLRTFEFSFASVGQGVDPSLPQHYSSTTQLFGPKLFYFNCFPKFPAVWPPAWSRVFYVWTGSAVPDGPRTFSLDPQLSNGTIARSL